MIISKDEAIMTMKVTNLSPDTQFFTRLLHTLYLFSFQCDLTSFDSFTFYFNKTAITSRENTLDGHTKQSHYIYF